MNKIFLGSVVLIMVVFIFIPLAFANGPASLYQVRLSKFELWNGSSWVTVFSGTSSTIDIASVASGSAAGNFLSGLTVPDGTYTQCRATPSPTFTFSGNDGASYTTAALGAGGGSTIGTAAQQAQCTITLTGARVPSAQTQDFSATPITVTDGVANHKVRVSFDVSNAVQTIFGELWPAAPVVTMSVQ